MIKKEEVMSKKIAIAEKAVLELVRSGNLKKAIDERIAAFYETRAINRLQTAKLIYQASKDRPHYSDYSEAVAAAYYAMYYIVHAYLAAVYRTKLRENLRGVHAITHNLVLYYLVKTKKLAKHLYDEYIKTLQTTSAMQNLTIDSFQEKAYAFAERYNKSREARETFTYQTTISIEAYHAERAIKTAEEFINTLRQLLVKNK